MSRDIAAIEARARSEGKQASRPRSDEPTCPHRREDEACVLGHDLARPSGLFSPPPDIPRSRCDLRLQQVYPIDARPVRVINAGATSCTA